MTTIKPVTASMKAALVRIVASALAGVPIKADGSSVAALHLRGLVERKTAHVATPTTAGCREADGWADEVRAVIDREARVATMKRKGLEQRLEAAQAREAKLCDAQDAFKTPAVGGAERFDGTLTKMLEEGS